MFCRVSSLTFYPLAGIEVVQVLLHSLKRFIPLDGSRSSREVLAGNGLENTTANLYNFKYKANHKRKYKGDTLEQFEDKRKEALELYHLNKLTIVDHALERMIERNIQYEDIESVLLQGSIYKQDIDKFGDIRYNIRGTDTEKKIIRMTFVIKENLVVITVIREQE